MQITRDTVYLEELDKILNSIAKHSLANALNFIGKLDHHISKIPYMPYKSRHSFYYDSEDVRDLIFKGYTIPYLVDNENQQIVLLDIFKWSNRKKKQ